MDIYVNSRGVSQDYRWLKVTQEKQEQIDPPIPQKVTDLIDSNYPSLVLASFQYEKDSPNKLMLLITGLETSKRVDNRTRKIRNSVAWVGQGADEADEKVLRSLAVQWLRNELTSKIDSAVESDKSNGFKVLFNNLPALNPIVKSNLKPDETNKIGNVEYLRNKLAIELEEYSLPKRSNSLLVVATEVNTEKDFQVNQVWRGLSTLVDSKDWKSLTQKKMLDQPNNQTNSNFFFKNYISVILSILLIISIGFNIYFLSNNSLVLENQKLKDDEKSFQQKYEEYQNLLDEDGDKIMQAVQKLLTDRKQSPKLSRN